MASVSVSRRPPCASLSYFAFCREAVEAYMAELTKWNAAAKKDTALIDRATTLGAASQVTHFEAQLARSLKKEDPKDKLASVTNSTTRYAAVPSMSVCGQLWEGAQKVLTTKAVK